MFNETVSQQCLEIEIINDSLPEDWKVFTLLLSTNNPGVNLSIHKVNVYIIDGKFGYPSVILHACNCRMLVCIVLDIFGPIEARFSRSVGMH